MKDMNDILLQCGDLIQIVNCSKAGLLSMKEGQRSSYYNNSFGKVSTIIDSRLGIIRLEWIYLGRHRRTINTEFVVRDYEIIKVGKCPEFLQKEVQEFL